MPRCTCVSEGLKRRGSSRGLVVLLHGWQHTPRNLQPLSDATAQLLPDFDCFAPALPIKHFLSRTRVEPLALDLLDRLDTLVQARTAWPDQGRYAEIYLVAHSLGAALARSVWALAHGAQPDATIDPDAAKPWAHDIRRLVLLAGVNRGWDPSSPVRPWIRLQMWFADPIENLVGPRFLMLDIRRGAPFLTTIRLQILALHRLLQQPGMSPPISVNILGTFDNVVPPTDNFDLATDSASDFYLEVEATGHESVLQLGQAGDALRRFEAFRLALLGSQADLSERAMSKEMIRDMLQESHRSHATDDAETERERRTDPGIVVFVVHGIRDYGFWTRRLAIRIKAEARQHGIDCQTITSSYGFFPMGPFLLPAERRKRVGWLLDQYVTARAMYPGTDWFCCVGHSNGTYLLANALENCPAVRFARVVFAGSVARRDYDWGRLLAGGSNQVGRVLNYVATRDLVVASIPAGVQAWTFRFSKRFQLKPKIGDAGHCGFRDTSGLVQVRYVPGGHSAALGSDRWGDIAAFVLGQADPPSSPTGAPPAAAPLAVGQGRLVRAVNAARFFIPAVALVVPALIGLEVLSPRWPWEYWGHFPTAELWIAVRFLVFAWLVSRVVTRL